MNLNEKQQQVVNELSESILLNAPAGTGKTRVLAARVANILAQKKAKGSEILCLTFTNRACKELKNRIIDTVPEEGFAVTVKTIHSFCYSLIKEETKRQSDRFNDFLIYDDEDCKQLLDSIDLTRTTPRPALQELQTFIEFEKKKRVIPGLRDFTNIQDDLKGWLSDYGEDLVWEYDIALADNHAIDFTDLITGAYEFLQDDAVCRRWREKFRFISVDEMQDTSEVEYTVISRLFPGRNILLCGDYFQTIYEWRGSYPQYIWQEFRNDYQPLEVTFTTNYRATQLLLEASQSFLFRTLGKVTVQSIYTEPGISASKDRGAPIVLHKAGTGFEEARWIFREIKALPPEERLKTCILVRDNRQAKLIWMGITSHNQKYPQDQQLPVTCIDQFHLFKRQECKDVLAYLRLVLNKHDNLSLKRVVQRFVPRIGRRTLETIESDSYRKVGLMLSDFIDPLSHQGGDPYGLLLTALAEGRLVVFDVESTGTDTTQDEIIQIAAIRLDAKGQPIDKFNTYVKAGRSVGTSYYVHHISDEKLAAEGIPPKEALTKFLAFAKEAVIVGHNVTYDLSILQSELQRLGISESADFPYYDTLDIYRRFYPTLLNHKLETLSRLFPSGHKPTHDAFDDILATAGLLIHAINEKIRPTETARRAAMAIYLPLFAPFSREMDALRRLSYQARPTKLITSVMNDNGVKAWYQTHRDTSDRANHIDRLENIRKLYRIAKETDDAEQNPRDALTEFLKMSALSNSELDSMLAKDPKIPIITIHQAKGLEFDYVFMASLEDHVFPTYWARQKGDIEEEKRLFYVAMTRAKKRLYLSWHQGFGRQSYLPSRFLNGVNLDYCEIR
ncbi:3'-5' exonuclease [Megasphaera sp.]|uniref:3'-5' exonuclease n=1 Tax=Megasphaera sp. TaxID=2023260 RepID=UPI001DABF942|nr:3'-5' exonuclease [Megasphaera sp.]MBS6103977.1 UvrD-helicase domain-containing protein [Megasphaera sp.]